MFNKIGRRIREGGGSVGQIKKQNIFFCQMIVFLAAFLFFNNISFAAPILKLNSHGHDVIVLQQNLMLLKYSVSKVSGNYDKETQDAVKAFQKDNRLSVTGIVNRETWWAIKGGRPTISTSSTSSQTAKPTNSPIWDNISSVPYGRTFLDKKEVSSIISTAKNYMGVPYVFGGASPEEGFDCSGFLEYVFARNGIEIPRTADEQYKLGKLVRQSQLVAGDLVFFTTYEPGASHCGIYLGNDKFIHASSSRGIRVDDLNDSYWASRYYGGKHIVK